MEKMTPERKQMLIRFEMLWWVLTLLVAAAVLFPVFSMAPAFPFFFDNIIFIVTFITLTRYIFLLPHTFLARRQILKLALMFLSVPFIFFLVQQLNGFQTFLDENGPEALVGALPYARTNSMTGYIRSEMLLFATGSIIAAVIFPFRMVVSVWRVRNLGRE